MPTDERHATRVRLHENFSKLWFVGLADHATGRKYAGVMLYPDECFQGTTRQDAETRNLARPIDDGASGPLLWIDT